MGKVLEVKLLRLLFSLMLSISAALNPYYFEDVAVNAYTI